MALLFSLSLFALQPSNNLESMQLSTNNENPNITSVQDNKSAKLAEEPERERRDPSRRADDDDYITPF